MLNMSGYDNIKMKCICFGINDSNYIWNLLKMVSLENEGRKILAVGICYNSKTKEHECKIEELS